MAEQTDSLFSSNEQLNQPSLVRQKIETARKEHPDSVVVYFVRHKSAPQSLPKPKNPLTMFKRSARIQEVFYALFQQIDVKGLAFYVIKTLDQNRVMYSLLQPGKTVGQIYDEFSYKNYLTLIYNKGTLSRWNISPKILRLLRLLIIIAMVCLVYKLLPLFQTDSIPSTKTFTVGQFEQS